MATCKKCGKEIPENMKKCPFCSKKSIETVFKAGKIALSVIGTVGAVAVTVITKGKINVKK